MENLFICHEQPSLIASSMYELFKQNGFFENVNLIDISILDNTTITIPKYTYWLLFAQKNLFETIQSVEKIHYISGASSAVIIININDNLNPRDIRKIGASGKICLLSDSTPPDSLLQIIEQIKDKDFVLSDDYKDQLLEDMFYKNNNEAGTFNLNNRELKIVEAAKEGYNIEQTAELLQMSRNTVASYRCKAMKKAGVHSIGKLVAMIQ